MLADLQAGLGLNSSREGSSEPSREEFPSTMAAVQVVGNSALTQRGKRL